MRSKLLRTWEASADPVISFDNYLTDEYQEYELIVNSLSVNLGGTTLGMRFGEGTEYYSDATSYDYHTRWYSPNSKDALEDAQTGATVINVSGIVLQAASQFMTSITIKICRLKGTGSISAYWDGIVHGEDGYLDRVWGGGNSQLDHLSSVQFAAINSTDTDYLNGVFSLYGINQKPQLSDI